MGSENNRACAVDPVVGLNQYFLFKQLKNYSILVLKFVSYMYSLKSYWRYTFAMFHHKCNKFPCYAMANKVQNNMEYFCQT